MKIGIFGGSFNPIHNGHIALGSTMLSAMSLDEVWYLVSPLNPWKSGAPDLLDQELRLLLTRESLSGYPCLKASDYEFHLPKPSYTWQTLEHLSQDYPDHQFTLIIGGDNFERFDRWAHYQDILSTYPIAVFPRAGSDHVSIAARLTSLDAKGITVVDVPEINVTSTLIRNKLRNGEDVTSYVPKKIIPELLKYYAPCYS